MKFVAKIFPFIPAKGDTTNLILGLLFYLLVPEVALVITTIVFTFSIILMFLIPVAVLLIVLYGFAGLLFTILSFAGVMDLKK